MHLFCSELINCRHDELSCRFYPCRQQLSGSQACRLHSARRPGCFCGDAIASALAGMLLLVCSKNARFFIFLKSKLGCLAGLIVAGNNSVAGKLADYTAQQGPGNIGCFYGGAEASALAGVLLFLCLDLGIAKRVMVPCRFDPCGQQLSSGQACRLHSATRPRQHWVLLWRCCCLGSGWSAALHVQ